MAPKKKKVDMFFKEEKEGSDGREYSAWSVLPNEMLGKIFSYLSMKERYNCSLVCKSWYEAFGSSYVWLTFTLEDSTPRLHQFPSYRIKKHLYGVGKYMKHLIINPMQNLQYLRIFMNKMSWYSNKCKKNTNWRHRGSQIETLKFTGPCGVSPIDEYEGIRVPKTDGVILRELKTLLKKLNRLHRIELIDLMLDESEARYLLKGVSLQLRTLLVVNTTIIQYPLLDVGMFPNLYQLVISPQNLNDNVVELIGNTNIRHLHILQTKYTPDTYNIIPVSTEAWKLCKKNNPLLSVHLKLKSLNSMQIVWQENAPVRSILYDSSHIKINSDEIMTVIDNYSQYLKAYGNLSLVKFDRSNVFHERADGSLILLLRQCPLLSTLVVTETISTETVLLLASTGYNLRRLYIRREAVIIKSDWEQNPDWTDEFFAWLKYNSCSHNLVEQKVSQIMGYKWKFISDENFLKLNIDMDDL